MECPSLIHLIEVLTRNQSESEPRFLKWFHSAKGVAQNNPPIVPKRTRVARVSKSLFGAPNAAPNMGRMKVRNEIGISCFRLGSQQPILCDIFFTANAETRIIPKNIPRAAPKEGGSSPIFNIISATNDANIAPVPAPIAKVCFKSIKSQPSAVSFGL